MIAMNEDTFSVWTIVKDLCFFEVWLAISFLLWLVARRAIVLMIINSGNPIIVFCHTGRRGGTGRLDGDNRFRGQLFFMKILIQRRPKRLFLSYFCTYF